MELTMTRLFEIFPSFVTGVYMVVWALLYSLLEISTEGGVGWALGAPTWRKKSWFYGAVMNGKELTGYHVVMFFLPYLFLHLPFIFAFHWGLNKFIWWRECELLAIFFVLCPAWDYWWFILNPDFTLERFRPGEIWWHAKWIGRVPVDYMSAGVSVALFTALASLGDDNVVRRMSMVLLCFMLATLLLIKLAPFYHRWYAAMKNMHRLATEDWVKWLYPEEMQGVFQCLEYGDKIRDHLACWGKERARREQTVPDCVGVLVRGNRSVPRINMFNRRNMVNGEGRRKVAVFRIADLKEAARGYRIGFRPSNAKQRSIGKERVLPEMHESEFFRVRIGRAERAFFAVNREGKEIKLVPVVCTGIDDRKYFFAPLC